MNDEQFAGYFAGLLNALAPLQRIQEMVNHSVFTSEWIDAYHQQIKPLEAIARQISAAMPRGLLETIRMPEALRLQLPDQHLGGLMASISSQVSRNILAAGIVPSPSPWPMPNLTAIGDFSHSFRELVNWQTEFLYQLRQTAEQQTAKQLPAIESYGQQLLEEMEQQPDVPQELKELRTMTAAVVQPTRIEASMESVQIALFQLVNLEQQNSQLLEKLVAQGDDAGKIFREYLSLVIGVLGLWLAYISLNQSAQQVARPERLPTSIVATTPTASGCILVVEDDLITARMMGRIVQGMGYTALESVSSGPEALAILRTAPVSLLLTNVELNGEMNGIALARQVRDAYGIPVLLVSGHSRDTLHAQVQAGVVQGFICKPYTDQQIEEAVRQVLKQKP